VAITSGKGGVGKTNLAVNLAIALAATGRRVLLVDADLGLANVDLVLGQRARGDLGHVLSGRMALGEIVQEGPAGIRWIPGASHMPAIARIGERRREALLERLTDLETQHDFVLLDAPPGIGQGVLHLVRQADEVLVVTTPEPPALMDAYALLKAAAAGGTDTLGRARGSSSTWWRTGGRPRRSTGAWPRRPRGFCTWRWACWVTSSATATWAARSSGSNRWCWPIRIRRPRGARGSWRQRWRRPASRRGRGDSRFSEGWLIFSPRGER
jgi:MinD-like ATPase involved in chromosome partitioning or flagellar assembly